MQGQTLQLFGWAHRQEVLYLILVLPDGSRSLIPASWTDLNREGQPISPADKSTSVFKSIGTRSHLLQTRKIIDSLLNKLNPLVDQSATLQEERTGATTTVPLARNAKLMPEDHRLAGSCPRSATTSHNTLGKIAQLSGDPQGGQP